MEMADIVRCAGQAFIEGSCRWINWQHRKVLLAIARCRTAALGGHRDRCTGCPPRSCPADWQQTISPPQELSRQLKASMRQTFRPLPLLRHRFPTWHLQAIPGWQRSYISAAQAGSIRCFLCNGPLIPPTATQPIPDKSMFATLCISGSMLRNRRSHGIERKRFTCSWVLRTAT